MDIQGQSHGRLKVILPQYEFVIDVCKLEVSILEVVLDIISISTACMVPSHLNATTTRTVIPNPESF